MRVKLWTVLPFYPFNSLDTPFERPYAWSFNKKIAMQVRADCGGLGMVGMGEGPVQLCMAKFSSAPRFFFGQLFDRCWLYLERPDPLK